MKSSRPLRSFPSCRKVRHISQVGVTQPVDATWQPVTASKLRREIPGAVTPVYRYAMAASILLVTVLFIVILVLSPLAGH